MNFKKCLMVLALCMPVIFASAQSKAPDSWFTLDPVKDKVNGTGGDETLKQLKAKGKKSQTVIVAVLDSGVDYKHEDLKDVMWTNPGEIPDNGKDDDNNGYIDDIHGWNFIGGKDGKNVSHDSYELTREYARLSKRFNGTDPKKLNATDKKEYDGFLAIKAAYEEKRGELEGQKAQMDAQFSKIEAAFKAVEKATGKKNFTAEDLGKIEPGTNTELKDAVAMCKAVMAQGLTPESLAEQKAEASEYFSGGLEYGYNTEFNPRTIVGDNYEDLTNRFYGNNDYRGPDASHGTHVAGIIAAKRDNGVGINGVADNVRIMSVRCVPDGDERDKDVANGIRYAVDNGAKVINMSFGKGWSHDKKLVDDAIRYAESKDVLLVHAAGNDAEDNDALPNFPNPRLSDGGRPSNWIEVGASNWNSKKLIAPFSNFGKDQVDVFAPGMDIYSTVPDSKYASFDGTSMASPVTAGVAALIRSYYPSLTAAQVKQCITQGSVKWKKPVINPTTKKKAKMKDLCNSGGLVNAYNALQIAAGMVK